MFKFTKMFFVSMLSVFFLVSTSVFATDKTTESNDSYVYTDQETGAPADKKRVPCFQICQEQCKDVQDLQEKRVCRRQCVKECRENQNQNNS